MFCSQCGTEFGEAGAFCAQCGAKRPTASLTDQGSVNDLKMAPGAPSWVSVEDLKIAAALRVTNMIGKGSSRKTEFFCKCKILGELWLDYRDDKGFKDFIEYNDLGLPLAYAVSAGIVEKSDLVEGYIDETFIVLLAATGVEDTGFNDLQEFLRQIPESPEETV